MLIFIVILIVAGISSLSRQLVRNDKRSARRHAELLAMLQERCHAKEN